MTDYQFLQLFQSFCHIYNFLSLYDQSKLRRKETMYNNNNNNNNNKNKTEKEKQKRTNVIKEKNR